MTCATINRKIKLAELDVKLYKGKGYYYFIPGEGKAYNIPSLYTMDINVYSLQEIIDHVKKHINK